MSKLFTAIPVQVAAVIAALPAGSFVHGVRFNEEENRVEVHFEHDDYKTGLDHPVEFKPEEFADDEPEAEQLEKQGDQAEAAAETSPEQTAAEGTPSAADKPAATKPAKAKNAKAPKHVRTRTGKPAAK